MAGTPGVSAKVFNSLGAASVNVRAIAQGASERNISVVIDGKDATKALRAAHAGFYLSPHTLSIGIIGPGTVGRVLLDQLASQAARLSQKFKVNLRVRGILASKRMVLSDTGIDLTRWKEVLESNGVPADLDRFVEHVRVDYLPHTVLIDCTANEAIGRRYLEWLGKRHSHRHAEQEGEQRRSGLLPQPARHASSAAGLTIFMRRRWARACR